MMDRRRWKMDWTKATRQQGRRRDDDVGSSGRASRGSRAECRISHGSGTVVPRCSLLQYHRFFTSIYPDRGRHHVHVHVAISSDALSHRLIDICSLTPQQRLPRPHEALVLPRPGVRLGVFHQRERSEDQHARTQEADLQAVSNVIYAASLTYIPRRWSTLGVWGSIRAAHTLRSQTEYWRQVQRMHICIWLGAR